MYRIASALQEQKYSGTDSVNARAGRLRRRHESSLSASQQSRCHPVRTAFLIILEESLPSSALRGPRAGGMQGVAETTSAAQLRNSLHSTFVPRFFLPVSGIFPGLKAHLTTPGAGAIPEPRLTWLSIRCLSSC